MLDLQEIYPFRRHPLPGHELNTLTFVVKEQKLQISSNETITRTTLTDT